MPELWDPLTYDTLMAGTVAHFEKQERIPLESVAGVQGPGIYALYYEGVMAEYRPIYAGKAVPKGSRTGGELDVEHPVLRERIRQHARSIEPVRNLDINDFSCRVLAIVPVWIVFAEQALIKRYRPVWNSCLDGFGKHDQGRRRSETERSWWDTLHPGRPWTVDETQVRTVAEASQWVKDFWEGADG